MSTISAYVISVKLSDMIFEALVGKAVYDIIRNLPVFLKKIAKKDGTLSLRESGFDKVKLGLTSFNEVITNTMED